MKTIQIPEKMYNSLVELAKEYVSQNDLGTRKPYLFQVKQRQRVCYIDLSQGFNHMFVDNDHCIEDATDFVEYVNDRIELSEEEEVTLISFFNNQNKRIRFRNKPNLTFSMFLEKYCPKLTQLSYDYEEVYSNAFFTAKGCNEHIQANKYNLSLPEAALNYAERNPEMELISDLLIEIAKK